MERTEAHKGDQCTNLVGRPRRLGFGSANGWAALSDVSGPFFGEWGLWAPSQLLSLRVYHMLMVFTISRLGLFVADNVNKPQTALACCTSKCHYSAYG